MKPSIKYLFLFALTLFVHTSLFAQIPSKIQDKLKANGINLSGADLERATKTAGGAVGGGKVDDLRAKDAAAKAQQEAEVSAAKAEKTNAQPKGAPAPIRPKNGAEQAELFAEEKAATDIQQNVEQAIQEGKSAQEAVSDAIQKTKEEVQLPPGRVYGHHLYRQRNVTTITNGINIKAPDTYILGVGDEISVNVWGRTAFSGVQSVSQDGYVKFGDMPRLYLKGLSYKQAQEKVTNSIERGGYNLSGSQIAITLNYTRTITVNVVGEVINPRSYTISAINTAINALAAANGPTNIGSVRNIRISSSGKPDRTLDLYKFLLNPLKSEEFFITNNDYVFVPPIGKVVDISGAIRRPLGYELLETENLKALLEWAGGLDANALKSNVQIRRFENDEIKILTVNLNDLEKSGSDFILKRGDAIMIPVINGSTLSPTKKVKIQGAVVRPNSYDLQMNEGLRALINKAEGLAENTYTGNIQIRRIENNEMKLYDISLKALDSMKSDFPLLRGDVVTLTAIDGDYYTNYADISGAVKLPGRYQVVEGKTRLSDFLIKAELKDDANLPLIYVSRLQTNLKRFYYRVNLEEVIKNPTSTDNILLNSKDEIFILSKAGFNENFKVTITGSVRNPGEQPLTANTTLRDVLFRAGGLTLDADRGKIEISRVQVVKGQLMEIKMKEIALEVSDTLYIQNDSLANFKLQPYDQIAVRRLPGYELLTSMTLAGEVKYPGVYTIISKTERIADVIKRAGGLTAAAEIRDATMTRNVEDAGFVILDLDKALKNKNSPYNYLAKPGDVITVPRAREMVSIEGAVAYPEIEIVQRISMSYRPGANLTYYIDEYAGGLSREKRGRYYLTSVRYPNGIVRSTKSSFFNLIKKYPEVRPGCVITVGAKSIKQKTTSSGGAVAEKSKVDWEDVTKTAFGTLTSVFTIILLSQTIFGSSR
jgi:polysaccharide biosynthesis/export protein